MSILIGLTYVIPSKKRICILDKSGNANHVTNLRMLDNVEFITSIDSIAKFEDVEYLITLDQLSRKDLKFISDKTDILFLYEESRIRIIRSNCLI